MVLDSGEFVLGGELSPFETEFAEFCGASHAVGVASGLDALQLALRAVGVGPGDEVITAANTFIATLLAISQVGAKPVLVDIDPDSYNMDVGCSRTGCHGQDQGGHPSAPLWSACRYGPHRRDHSKTCSPSPQFHSPRPHQALACLARGFVLMLLTALIEPGLSSPPVASPATATCGRAETGQSPITRTTNEPGT